MFWNVQFLAHVQALTFAHVAMPFARWQQQATDAASESTAGPTRSCRLNAKAARQHCYCHYIQYSISDVPRHRTCTLSFLVTIDYSHAEDCLDLGRFLLRQPQAPAYRVTSYHRGKKVIPLTPTSLPSNRDILFKPHTLKTLIE